MHVLILYLQITRGVNIYHVYHRTLERNIHEIMSNGLNACYRSNGEGYAKNDLIYKFDKSLDLLNEKLSLKKPKRLKSNFAWLNLDYAKQQNLHSSEKEVILRLEVNPSMVFVSYRLLWAAARLSFTNPGFSFQESSFEELGSIYWLNVVDLNTFLQTNYEIKFTDDFDDDLKNHFIESCGNKNSLEVIIPNRIEPSKISLSHHC